MPIIPNIVKEVELSLRSQSSDDISNYDRSNIIFERLDELIDERMTDAERMQAIREEGVWGEILEENANADRGGWVRNVRDIVNHVLGAVAIDYLDNNDVDRKY